jgi:uncharacterized protein involved in cysteine biosynthesis
LPRAVRELSRSPELWPWALAPTLVFLAISAGVLAFALFAGRPWFVARLPEVSGGLARVGESALGYGFALVVSVAGWFVALALAPLLSAPALEALVRAMEARTGAPPRAELGFFGELACGVRSFVGGALLVLPIFVVLSLVELAFPAAAPVTVPLAGLASVLWVAWSLFDYPLTLRGVGFRERLALVRRHFSCVLGFGVAFALAFWLPCAGIVLLPVGACAATLLVSRILGWQPAS